MTAQPGKWVARRFGYTAETLLSSEDGPWANDTVSLTYNSGRLRGGLSLQEPAGSWTHGFAYDGAERLASVSSPAGMKGSVLTFDTLRARRRELAEASCYGIS